MRLREREGKKVSTIMFSCWWSSQITAWKRRERERDTAFTSFITDGQNRKKNELFLIMAIECFKV